MSVRTRRQLTRSSPKEIRTPRYHEIIDNTGMMAFFSEKTLEELEVDLKMAEKGTHPYLISCQDEFEEKMQDSLERTEISNTLTKQLLKEEYEMQLAQISKDTDEKLRNMRAEMEKDLEMLEKRTEMEYSCLEINKPTTSNHIDVTKKTLRGRGGGTLIEPPTYFNATPRAPVPAAITANYLLPDHEVLKDLNAIFSNSASITSRSQKLYDVHLQKMKFVYEGKSYKQGEEVYVENDEYGKIPAKAENITDSVVFFRATQSWDIRQVHASLSDLIEGRVKVYKKKNN
ncbi:unnamed protein product [Caenorhabditis bovis]|uniref:Uncharacterized protein n=1 Tax=Caenorhabditis bovis TaxID=2654633 RepID=A0A8S1ERD1_9PELO|nr:unnamed protein product [Caenorhabditis bovis]